MEPVFKFKKGRQYRNPMYESMWNSGETKNLRVKDNDKLYNSSGADCWGHRRIRVPKLSANKRVWVNFYNLFPFLKGCSTYKGLKLKQV